MEDIVPLINDDKSNQCPLFFPVCVPKGRRDDLKRHLIKNKIYCPIHWPLTEYHKNLSERAKRLYDEELSLVCDQRYGVEDMHRIVSCIRGFFVKKRYI